MCDDKIHVKFPVGIGENVLAMEVGYSSNTVTAIVWHSMCHVPF